MECDMFKVQAHEKRTIGWWYQKREKIDFEPPYQRKGNLWGDKDKAYLIDSILNEYDIPKIYLTDFTVLNTNLNKRNLPYAIIDGRQRIEAIFGFFEGKVVLNNDFVLFGQPTLKLGGYAYGQLKSRYPEIAEIFEQFNLDVMSVIADDIEKIKDLFVRLNRSKALTGAELRNAMEGVVPELIRGLTDRHFFKSNVKFNTSRGQDGNIVAKLLLIEFHGRFVDTKKKHLDKFVRDAAATSDLDPYYESAFRVEKTLAMMEGIFQEKDPLLTSYGMIPLYYGLIKKYGEIAPIRPFIAYFSKARRENQAASKVSPENVNTDLLTFDANVRSINDAGALDSAYKLLEMYYLKFSI